MSSRDSNVPGFDRTITNVLIVIAIIAILVGISVLFGYAQDGVQQPPESRNYRGAFFSMTNGDDTQYGNIELLLSEDQQLATYSLTLMNIDEEVTSLTFNNITNPDTSGVVVNDITLELLVDVANGIWMLTAQDVQALEEQRLYAVVTTTAGMTRRVYRAQLLTVH